MADFAPTHPGEILKTEFLEPLGISQYRVAKTIDVPARRINEIVHGKRGISADTALRLSRALGVSDMFFINMQARYDAEIAREHIGTELATIERIA
jgi:antitoxin HigA-1